MSVSKTADGSSNLSTRAREKHYYMNKVFGFIKGSVDEMTNNVTWSKYSELQSSTVLVIVASLIFAVLIGLVDLLFKNVMESIY